MNTKDRNKECCSVQQVEEYPKREVEFVFGLVTIRSGKLEKHTRSKVPKGEGKNTGTRMQTSYRCNNYFIFHQL